ncbi:hypothetical protein ANANG_G00117220 [Anguilla anguilla]|uniref:Phospholamban n=1 Tax=Anguilla anguilla TaxID=7936 RepID=A0A9D3MFL9_ANGAN|nr:hypothetical protein ANANG_G00117220 [Anguilla anguilla]
MEKVQHMTRSAIRRASTIEVNPQAKQRMQELFVNFCLILICLLLMYIIVLLILVKSAVLEPGPVFSREAWPPVRAGVARPGTDREASTPPACSPPHPPRSSAILHRAPACLCPRPAVPRLSLTALVSVLL